MNEKEIRERLYKIYPAFGSLLDAAAFIPSQTVFPCGTDGKNIFYNENLLSSFTERQQLFFFARELIHIALEHPSRGRDKDPRLWNSASNAVASSLLARDGFEIPSGIPMMPEAENSDAETLYQQILRGEGGIMELEEQTEDALPPQPVQLGNGPGEGKEAPQKQSYIPPPVVTHSYSFRVPRPGETTSGREKSIRDIGVAEKLQGLTDLLEASVNRDYDWFPGDTVRDGLVRDVFRGYPVPQAEIVIDTSMSVNEDLLKAFLRYVKALLNGAMIRVGCFDTRFYGFHDIETEQDIDRMSFQGFGGTNFTAAVEAFTGDAENRIIFTDGYAEMPEQRCDAIWVVYGSSEIKPKGGRVLYINDIVKNTTGGFVNEVIPT